MQGCLNLMLSKQENRVVTCFKKNNWQTHGRKRDWGLDMCPCHRKSFFSFLFLRFYLFIFRERGREGEREGEKHQCVVASHVAPTGDHAHNLGICPAWESNRQPFGSQPTLNPLIYTSQDSSLSYKPNQNLSSRVFGPRPLMTSTFLNWRK